MNFFNVTVEMVEETCNECGLTFAVTAGFQRQRLRDGEDFYCPNGHAQSYIADEERERERRRHTLEDRQEIVLALHRAEQAEAKAADEAAAAARERGEDDPRDASESVSTETPEKIVIHWDGRKLRCPRCAKRYTYRTSIETHLKRVHNLTLPIELAPR